MMKKKPAKQRGMKTPKGKRSEPPKAGKVQPPYRRNLWDTKSKWESDDLGSGYK
jgi:hypothetical protein